MNAGSPWLRSTYNASPSTPPAPSCSTLPTARLVTPRRWDLAVKWRYFRAILGCEPDCAPEAITLYLWHIEKRSGRRMSAGLATDGWKRTLPDYITSAEKLLKDMAHHGFRPEYSIPIDPNGELLDGSHRLACALALGLPAVPVVHRTQYVWAPAWGEAWFVENGMTGEDLERLRQDWKSLSS